MAAPSRASLDYRYGAAARRQAAGMLVLALLALLLLLWALVTNWARLGGWPKLFGPLLMIILLFTLRAQLGRLRFRLHITGDAVEIDAPLQHRRVRWSIITKVHQMGLPQFGRQPRWACTIYLTSRRGTPMPVLLFDNQLEQADEALAQVIAHTPQAQHYPTHFPHYPP
ncbi:MAG: hypothetical protein H0X37_11900 [Herpetosiphonaceae bacterium]|nr:hypothetical protein [Herpetosiphonaceae bacterium]